MKKSLRHILTACAILAATPAAALDAEAINRAGYTDTIPDERSAMMVKLQVLLDRANVSPGVIDGYWGGNTQSAIRAYERLHGLPVDGRPDEMLWRRLTGMSGAGDDIVGTYTIAEDDAARLRPDLPGDYALLAEMEWLGHTSVAEAVAEKFHMDIDFLRELNPRASFSVSEQLTVTRPGANLDAQVTRVRADKSESRIFAYGAADEPVASYPVTIGSAQNPSPTGTHEVVGIAVEPTYAYKPDENFQQGDNDEQLTLPPGPNGPVGLVWIDLSKPTYGLHGTSDPATIAKNVSHGCVRLTNWDALELARNIDRGATVVFDN
ncbi:MULTISPECIES: L,D-transpeptidase [unclassified Roseitalea]|uniref:L,D-transpeptidase family protein n=1 Tax=unclassified Roseitalea TaxID=2639107 RepID=UPI00273D829B|nr:MULTISPECIES: L,D-transpeptidase [unclassified Roseitalea]